MRIQSQHLFLPKRFLTLAVLLYSMPSFALNLAQNFSFDGVLVSDTTGVPLTGPASLRFQIYDPAGTCLLFDENHAAVALQSNGAFNLKVGTGARVSPSSDGGLALKQVFQNIQTVRTTGANCSPGYTPAAGDGRRLRVTVNGTALSPDYSLSPMPMATVAETLQGRTVSDFVSTTAATSLLGPMTMSDQGEIRFESITGANYVSLRAPPALGSSTTFFLPSADGTSGQCLTTNGAGQMSWAPCSGGGGPPTGPAGGALAGSYPNPSLAPTAVTPGTYPKVTVGADGRVTGGMALTNADLTPIALMGDVTGGISTTTVDRIRGVPVSGTVPTLGNIFKYNGSQWEPTPVVDIFTMGGTIAAPLTVNANLSVAGAGRASIPPGSASMPSLQVGSPSFGLFNPGGTLGFSAGATERMRIDGAGNVGIGTATPAERLHVAGGSIMVDSGFVMSGGGFETMNPSMPASPAYRMITADSGLFHNGTRMGFSTIGIERMSIIASNGFVGIGTSTPATTFQVNGVISPSLNNVYTLGNATFRFTEVYATNGVVNTSDRREKKDIYNTDLGLEFINKLRPVSYRWNTGVDDDVHYGLIAQEAEQAIAELGKSEKTSIVTHDETSDRYGVRYSELISPLIKAVQELYSKLLGVDREIAELKARAQKAEQENAAMKAYLCRKDSEAPICK